MKIARYKVINLYDKLITVHYDDTIKNYRTDTWCENRNKNIMCVLNKNISNNLTYTMIINNGKTYNYFDKFIFIELNQDNTIKKNEKF